jgi:phage gp36-like protein
MPFLTPDDLKTHIYGGVVTTISRTDADLLQAAVDTSIAQVKGYMSRYDYAQILDNVNALPGYVKDPILLMYVKNLVKWHFIVLANPSIDYEDAKTRFAEAIQWLKDVQSGKFVPDGWPPAVVAEKATFFHTSSAPKRLNRF